MLNVILGGMVLGFAASPTCPSNAEEIRMGARAGFRLAALVGLGAVLGDAAVLGLVLLGLIPLLQSYPLLNSLMWLLGGLVLIYIAWSTMAEANREAQGSQLLQPDATGQRGVSGFHSLWRGFAITALNPFTGLWWIGLLGPITASGSAAIYAFSAAVLAGSLIWFLGLAGILHLGRGWLRGRSRRWTYRLSGLAVLGFGLYFIGQAGLQVLGA